jgi:DNA-binding transcriptional LysR family regulator
MTFTQLGVWIALIETRSFSRAAVRLCITQSGVSHAVGALEKQFKVSLIDRDAAEFALTEAGAQFSIRAREMLALSDTLTQEMSDLHGLRLGTLRIGSFGPTSTLKILPPLLAEFKKRFPKVQVRIEEESDEVVDQWLLEKRVELGFVVAPDQRFEVKLLANDEFVAILPAKHPLAKLKAVPINAFDGLDFVLTEAGGAPVVEPILKQFNAKPNVLYRFPQMISIVEFARSNLAVSIAARLALPDPPKGVVYRPLAPAQPRCVGIACLSAAKLSPLAKAFWSMAKPLGEIER